MDNPISEMEEDFIMLLGRAAQELRLKYRLNPDEVSIRIMYNVKAQDGRIYFGRLMET